MARTRIPTAVQVQQQMAANAGVRTAAKVRAALDAIGADDLVFAEDGTVQAVKTGDDGAKLNPKTGDTVVAAPVKTQPPVGPTPADPVLPTQ